MLARLPLVQLGLHQHDGHGHTEAADGLGHGDHIRHDACPLEGEEVAAPAAAHLNVVYDEQNVILVAQSPQVPEPLGIEHIDAAVGLDGLQNDGRRLLHAGVIVGEQPLHIGDGVQLREHIRSGNVGHVGQNLPGAVPGATVRGQRQGAQGHAMESAHEGEDIFPALDLPGQLGGTLHGVGAGGTGELNFVIKSTGGKNAVMEILQEFPLGSGVHIHGVDDTVILEIVADPPDHFVRVVAEVQGAGPGEEVDVFLTVLVLHDGALGTGEHRGEAAAVRTDVGFKGFKNFRIHKEHFLYSFAK